MSPGRAGPGPGGEKVRAQGSVVAVGEDSEPSGSPGTNGRLANGDAPKVFEAATRLPGGAVPILVVNVILAATSDYVYSARTPGNGGG